MTRTVVTIGALMLLAAIPTSASAKAAAPGILYPLDASRAEVTQADGAYRLSLPAATHATWFADRPDRRAGMTTLRGLASIRQASGFAADPPNAAVIVSSEGRELTHVVELRRPQVAGRLVSFAMRALPAATVTGFVHADALTPGAYRHAAVFIDDAATAPCATSVIATAPTAVTSPPTTSTCLLTSSPAGRTTIYPARMASRSTSTTPSTVDALQTDVSACSSGAAFTMGLGNGYVTVPSCTQGSAALMQLVSTTTSTPSAQVVTNSVTLPNGTTAPSSSALVLTVTTLALVAIPPPPTNSYAPSTGVALIAVTTVDTGAVS